MLKQKVNLPGLFKKQVSELYDCSIQHFGGKLYIGGQYYGGQHHGQCRHSTSSSLVRILFV